MTDIYDQDGNQITMDQWSWLLARGEDYRRLASDEVGSFWVSTVWLGLNHNWRDGPPLIFETMVFPVADGEPDFGTVPECTRYSTRDEALAGHAEVVTLIRATHQDLPNEEVGTE